MSQEIVKATRNPDLIPFQKGYDPRRNKNGRPGRLDDPEYVDLVAKALATGKGTGECARDLSISPTTMREYKKDPRVEAVLRKYIEERILRITRRVDSQIEQRLEKAEGMDTVTLLKIRKEFLGGIFRQQAEGSATDDKTINEAVKEIEGNPQLITQLQEVISRSREKNAEEQQT